MNHLIRTISIVIMFCITAASVHAISLDEITSGAEPREIIYKTVGDIELSMFMVTPGDFEPSDSRTAVVWIHGGAWTSGYPQQFFPQCRYYASRGAVAFSIQYRLVGTDGETVFDCLEDCKSAVRYLRMHASELGIDPKKIVVMGESAGGHLSACLGIISRFDNPDEDRSISSVPNAMVLYNPVTDMTVPSWVRLFRESSGPLGDRTPAQQARAISPLFQVSDLRPPSMILHGDADTIVPLEQAIDLAEELKGHQSRCDLEIFPGAAHSFVIVNFRATPDVVVDSNRRGDAFLVSLGLLEGEPTLTVD